jgi:hypothetical protein
MGRVHFGAALVLREHAARIQLRVGQLGLADAGGRGAQDQRDARGAVLLARRGHRLDEAVGLQAQPGQPVVAAVPRGQRLGQADVFQAVDAADPGGQRRIAEIVGAQAAARLFERFGERALPTPTAEVAV